MPCVFLSLLADTNLDLVHHCAPEHLFVVLKIISLLKRRKVVELYT